MTRILIADDDESSNVLGSMLQCAKYEVEYARDGREVLRLWLEGCYQLILMDVEMAPMDGLTATLMIRMKEQTLGGYTPIIALTAHTSEQSRRNCFAAGMDACLSKPLIFSELLHLMEEMLTPQREPHAGRRSGWRSAQQAGPEPLTDFVAAAGVENSRSRIAHCHSSDTVTVQEMPVKRQLLQGGIRHDRNITQCDDREEA